MRRFVALLLSTAVIAGVIGICPSPALAQTPAGSRYAVIISGIGGEPVYADRFWTWASGLYRALNEAHGIPQDHLFLLVEEAPQDSAIPAWKSDLKAIKQVFSTLAQRVTTSDALFVMLIGHGSATGGDAKLNIPGPDLTASELDRLLSSINASRIAVINGASASAPFIHALSRQNRVVVTATKSARERHATVFPAHFLTALSAENSDLDKDGQVSLLEAFTYARQKTAAWYEEKGRLATEHPLLDDNGDGVGSRDPGKADADGQLARTITFGVQSREETPAQLTGEALAKLKSLEAKSAKLQQQIETLKSDKPDLAEADYTARMQTLLLELARVNQEINQWKDNARATEP